MIESRSLPLWNDEAEARRPLMALWRQLALISLTFALVDGFGAYTALFSLTPMKYVGVQLILLTATLILCPAGSLHRVFLPIPSLLLIGWWVTSYMWETNRAGWISTSSRDFATVVTVVVLGQLLGRRDFVRCLLRSGYIAIGFIFFALLVQPGDAYSVGGPAPGLHGGFIHKNVMAPCLLLTAIAVICLHPNTRFRRNFVVFTAALLFLGQTTSGLATLVALLFLNWAFANYNRMVQRLGRSAGSLLVAATLIVVAVAATTFSSIVMLSGKDLTFSSRTVIWDGVTAAISGRPWLGYGYGVWSNLWVEPVRTINLNNGFIVAHAHNAALDLMIRLGIVGLGCYVLQLFNTVRAGWRGLLRDDPFGRLVLLYCLTLVLFGFSESSPAFGVWLALLITFAAFRTHDSNADTVVGERH